mmetsp:Transcript_8789/g.23731  ORF Transcript_8789/g.23731 Transcript_8789/m.23731 type:complete len:334 (-) Transcript_8789:165-1166(-)
MIGILLSRQIRASERRASGTRLVSVVLHGIHPLSSVSRSSLVAVPVPVEAAVVVRVALASEEVAEHSSQVGDVWLGLELEGSAVRQVLGELRWAALAQGWDGDALLLLHDELVLLGGGLGLESLPWESSLEEVDEDVPDGLEIVTTGLLHTQVIVDGCVTWGSCQRTSLALWDVLQCSGVTVSLGETEIDTVDEVAVSTATVCHEVSWLDISVNQVTRMHELHTLEHLIGNHENGLEGESSSALVELVLEGWSEQIHDHEVVGVLCSEVVDLGETWRILQLTVHLVLVTKLRASCSVLLELHSDLFAVGADTKVDVSEGTSSDTLGDAVFRDG